MFVFQEWLFTPKAQLLLHKVNQHPFFLRPSGSFRIISLLVFPVELNAPKKHIHEHIRSFDEDVGASAIDTYIHRLRRKIDHPRLSIRTIRGLGYMLEHA